MAIETDATGVHATGVGTASTIDATEIEIEIVDATTSLLPVTPGGHEVALGVPVAATILVVRLRRLWAIEHFFMLDFR
jgi:hypothetical protein